MARAATGFFLLMIQAWPQQPPAAPPIISAMTARVSEEAEVFARSARSVLSEETLRQRARKPETRFRARAGGAAKPPKDEFVTREVVSEYGYSSYKDSPNALHEFRTVITIDGRKFQTLEKARRALSLGVTSADDELKKQMLRDFEKHGLIGAVTDFGQVVLLFTRRRLPDYEFAIMGQERVGAETAAVLSFKQKAGKESLTVFTTRSAVRSGLQGYIWVRLPDYLPLRIRLLSARKDGAFVITTDATVDYGMSPHGCILPTRVEHREYIPSEPGKPGGALLAENIFQYAPFRKFSAESELKFTDVPIDPPK
jgi:hypothetical protein